MPCNVSHFSTETSPVHVTYRLHGSVPKSVDDRLASLKRSAIADARRRLEDLPGRQYFEAWQLEMDQISRRLEAASEAALHTANYGPMYLRDPELQTIVLQAWQFLAEQKAIDLHAVCVMSNHVHVVFSAITSLPVDTGALLRRHKTFTANRCNRRLGRSGHPFWARNYFDRTVRRGRWMAAMRYVLDNPVKANLVKHWQDYAGTFVNPDYLWQFVDDDENGNAQVRA